MNNLSNGKVILPEVWDKLVGPGRIVEMRTLPVPQLNRQPENIPRLLLEPSTSEQDIYLPDNAQKVDVRQGIEDGQDIYYFRVEKVKYRTEISERLSRRNGRGWQDHECYLSTGKKSGLPY
jgi:hypothetical protein